MPVKETIGNLITKAEQGDFDVIAHGCNTHCTMGSGIAVAIKNKWPEAYAVDCETTKGDKNKLGSITFTKNIPNLTVVNCYTQHEYGRDVKVYADYDAIEKCMIELKNKFSDKRIGLPRIGAGLARGDWSKIKGIIDKVFCDPTDDITIVEFEDDVKKKNSINPNSILDKLFAFSKSSQSTDNDTQQDTSSVVIQTDPVINVQKTKKFHGKRKCKICHTKKPIKDMVNYVESVWVCKESCHDEFYAAVATVNNVLATTQLSNNSVTVSAD